MIEFRIGLENSFAKATGPKHRVIDVIRIALWYAEIQHRLGLKSTYAVEKALEPEAFFRSAEMGGAIRYHRNKWRNYRVGRHKPNRDLVKRVEKAVPGTEHLLNHILWEVLTRRIDLDDFFNTGIYRLSPEVQFVLVDFTYTELKRRHDLSSLAHLKRLKMLERRAGLDALAVLTALFMYAVEHFSSEDAYRIGFSLRRVLLITVSSWPFLGLSDYLFRFYFATVLSQSTYETKILPKLLDFDFVKAINYLNHKILCLEDLNIIGGDLSKIRHVKLDILEGYYPDKIMKLPPGFLIDRYSFTLSGACFIDIF